MPLLGPACMLLNFDIVAEQIDAHDDWHTQEHMPERLGIPGFLRGTRWIATQGSPRYLVTYEVAGLEVLTSAAYLERLNNPTPWTTKTMPHYRGMRRGLCAVAASAGYGTGNACRLLRFKPADAHALRARLSPRVQALAALPGIAGAHLLEGAAAAPMTNEQRIRGADAGVDAALLVTAYRAAALDGLAAHGLDAAGLAALGAADVAEGTYRFDYALPHGELARGQGMRP